MNDMNLILCGDIHGELKTLINKLEVKQITDANVIICGDFGVGFESFNYWKDLYKNVEHRLEKINVIINVVRGNHDDPSYFDKGEEFDFPRLKFLNDYKLYDISGYKVLPIGGANSYDIEYRHDLNKELKEKGCKYMAWWEGEDVKRVGVYKDLPPFADIIVTHECPIVFDPVCTRPDDLVEYQYKKIVDSREYLKDVLDHIKVDYWFYGHYHTSYSGSYNNLMWKCLDILELYQAPEKKDHTIQGELEK